jgi:cell division protein FtsB
VFKTLESVNTMLRSLVSLAFLALAGAGAWFGYQFVDEKSAHQQAQAKLAEKEVELQKLTLDVHKKAAQISTLQNDLELKIKENQRLAQAMKLLKVDHRIGQITVLSQHGSVKGRDLTTTFDFIEVNDEGQPLEKPRVFTVKGDVVYIDAWVAKFDDKYVEQGDPLRGTSICLFRRVFGESQAPDKGAALDPVGTEPTAYRNGGKPSALEQQIWSRFWDYANSPKLAAEVGARAFQGEAPSMKMVVGKQYRVLLRASGGLTIIAQEPAADSRKPSL